MLRTIIQMLGEKPMTKWTTYDTSLFYAHLEEIAGNADAATMYPDLRDTALAVVESKRRRMEWANA